MITKIQIDKVASYKSPAALETDRKVNVVYGLNGSGKSTLSNFLYDTEASGYSDCSVDIESDVSLYVYNQRFIEEHFFEADALKGIFSLSKENKDVDTKVKAAQARLESQRVIVTNEAQAADTRRRDLAKRKADAWVATWEIKKTYAGGDRVLECFLDGLKGNKETLYTHLSGISMPNEKPAKSVEQLKSDVGAIQGESAQEYQHFETLEFSEHSIETDPIFEQMIVGNTNSSVAGLIQELRNSDWVREGLTYVQLPNDMEPGVCPFCQSRTISSAVASEIKSYFDKSYDDLTQRLSRLHSRYSSALEEIASLEAFKSNPYSIAQLPGLTEKHGIVKKRLEDNLRKIEKKINTPSSEVSLVSTQTDLENFNATINNINSHISKHNDRIRNKAAELESLKQQFWEVMRWEYDQTISTYDSNSVDANRAITECQNREQAASKAVQSCNVEITNLQKSTVNIEEAVGKINEGLLQIGISDFAIAKYDDSLYKIVRQGNSTADFSSLSEGEKMLISFLYFCELCKGKRSALDVGRRKIAVIDDPISSLSHIFVFNIGRLIKNDFFDSNTFEQVFVLTHSLYFFYELADSNHKKRKENQKLFRLFKNSTGSQVLNMKYEEIQNDYHSYWSIVSDSNQPPALIANCMRNIVEYFFNFVQKQDLSNVLQMPELQANRFQAFCRYINRESHSLGQNIFDYKEFDYDAFRDGLELVFQSTGYSEHYEKMISVMGKN